MYSSSHVDIIIAKTDNLAIYFDGSIDLSIKEQVEHDEHGLVVTVGDLLVQISAESSVGVAGDLVVSDRDDLDLLFDDGHIISRGEGYDSVLGVILVDNVDGSSVVLLGILSDGPEVVVRREREIEHLAVGKSFEDEVLVAVLDENDLEVSDELERDLDVRSGHDEGVCSVAECKISGRLGTAHRIFHDRFTVEPHSGGNGHGDPLACIHVGLLGNDLSGHFRFDIDTVGEFDGVLLDEDHLEFCLRSGHDESVVYDFLVDGSRTESVVHRDVPVELPTLGGSHDQHDLRSGLAVFGSTDGSDSCFANGDLERDISDGDGIDDDRLILVVRCSGDLDLEVDGVGCALDAVDGLDGVIESSLIGEGRRSSVIGGSVGLERRSGVEPVDAGSIIDVHDDVAVVCVGGPVVVGLPIGLGDIVPESAARGLLDLELDDLLAGEQLVVGGRGEPDVVCSGIADHDLGGAALVGIVLDGDIVDGLSVEGEGVLGSLVRSVVRQGLDRRGRLGEVGLGDEDVGISLVDIGIALRVLDLDGDRERHGTGVRLRSENLSGNGIIDHDVRDIDAGAGGEIGAILLQALEDRSGSDDVAVLDLLSCVRHGLGGHSVVDGVLAVEGGDIDHVLGSPYPVDGSRDVDGRSALHNLGVLLEDQLGVLVDDQVVGVVEDDLRAFLHGDGGALGEDEPSAVFDSKVRGYGGFSIDDLHFIKGSAEHNGSLGDHERCDVRVFLGRLVGETGDLDGRGGAFGSAGDCGGGVLSDDEIDGRTGIAVVSGCGNGVSVLRNYGSAVHDEFGFALVGIPSGSVTDNDGSLSRFKSGAPGCFDLPSIIGAYGGVSRYSRYAGSYKESVVLAFDCRVNDIQNSVLDVDQYCGFGRLQNGIGDVDIEIVFSGIGVVRPDRISFRIDVRARHNDGCRIPKREQGAAIGGVSYR